MKMNRSKDELIQEQEAIIAEANAKIADIRKCYDYLRFMERYIDCQVLVRDHNDRE